MREKTEPRMTQDGSGREVSLRLLEGRTRLLVWKAGLADGLEREGTSRE
jgi:hypothetical protein